jgi:UDP-4-amino-4,6-dideoxy-L-N-acetyl-beta-L-altrosamine transaminase
MTVFVYIEPETGNIDTSIIQEQITDKTKLLVPVHYAGHPANMAKVHDIAKKHNLKVIEDAAHAIGASYENTKVGSCKYSDITIFSFHPVKHITTGEGGAILTNNKEYYDRAMMYRTHGITKENLSKDEGPWYYEMNELGFNYRITDIQAVLGSSQLNGLSQNIANRKRIYKKYQEAFKDNTWFNLPIEKEYASSAWNLFPIRLKDNYLDKKRNIVKALFYEGIGTQTHYIPVHTQPYYCGIGYNNVKLPKAELFYKKEISLPMYHSLSEEDQERVIDTVQKVFKSIE